MPERERRHILQRRSRWLIAAALFIALAPGCGDPVSVETDILIARHVDQSLELTNTTTKPVYYFAADRDGLALLDWAVCVDPATCDAVPASSTKTISLEDVTLYNPQMAEVVVYHWRLVAGQSSTGYVADSIRTIIVPVR